MVVNSREKVETLNADRVDGKNAGQFLPSAWYRQSDSVTIVAGSFAAVTVACDAGDHLLSGGYLGKNRSTNARDSYPTDTGAGWNFWFRNQGAGSDTIFIHACCADFPPRHSAVTSADEPPRD